MTTKIHIKGIRPSAVPSGQSAGAAIPADWIIFNAPRPLYASHILKDTGAAWNGEFVHGVFYTAVNPADEWTIKRNGDLDAWELIYHTAEEIVAWGKEYLSKLYPGRDIDWSDFDQHDFDATFFNQMNKHLRG